MSQRQAYDALPYNIPRHIRSKLLPFDAEAAGRLDDVLLQPRLLEQASIPEFKYQGLPQNRKVIRILRLWPGVLENPQIDCEMFEAEFDEDDKFRADNNADSASNGGTGDNNSNSGRNGNNWSDSTVPDSLEPISIKYEALSWRWGDEKNGKYAVMIHKDGKLHRKRVSETLGLALKYLRFEEERFLWIDAICINQDKDDERSSQVAMMSLVYAAATKACVWLGEDDVESTMAIKFIREDINQLKNFDSLCKDQQHAPKWRSLLMLMQRPWFSRRWVVQEIVLAKNALVYCGPDKIEWQELAIAVELFVEVETATHRLSELMKKDDKFSVIPNWFEHISELGASLLVNATARVYRSREIEETDHNDDILGRKGASRRSLLSLEYLVTSLSIFDCGRPHDSVYALVAIARDARPFAPSALIEKTQETLVSELCEDFLEQKCYILDYSSPYPDVCRDFTQFCIERCASVDKVQALDILCRPWAKDWRPGETVPGSQEQKVEKQKESETSESQQQKTPAQATKPERLYVIRIKVQELRKRPAGADDKQKLIEILKELQYPNPKEFVEVWNCGREPYYKKRQKVSTKKTRKARVNGQGNGRTTPIRATGANGVNGAQTTTEQTQIICPAEKELALPSWVVRITAAPFDIFPHPGMDMVKMGRKNADPLVGAPQDGHRNYNAGQTKKLDLKTLKFRRRPRCHHYSLYVEGFWLDTVESVAQVSQGGAIPGEWLDMAGWPEARRPHRPGEVLPDPPPEFWRTLVADRGMYDRNPPYYYARACKETIVKGGLQSGAVDTTALMYNERNSIVAEFCRRVQAVIWNRALIKTEKGNLGLASNKVQKGDMVCIIYGCTVPLILRKKEYKSMQERRLEIFEDGVESMKRLVRKCEKYKARRADWERKKDAAYGALDIEQLWEVKAIEKATEEFNSRIKRNRSEAVTRLVEMEYPEDYESEDLTDDEETAKNEGRKKTKQEKAKQRDPYRHYEFLGESYIHGMMDGEAVRQNFYKLKPDHLFEIR
ncbi:heterokaryon incompatibility protein-domain-containing protein [Leptodontidium sp. MPI-SDFR-AT-0119]|nr:heterokaryon incompatibility protein-domain-containing protein [Leptodontidium sp. MPI-SDFR-AT-0119]